MILPANRQIFLSQAVQPSLHLPQETLKAIRTDHINSASFIVEGKLLPEA